MRGSLTGKTDRKRLARAFVLTCLAAHAFLVSAIHFHFISGQHAATSRSVFEANQADDSNDHSTGGHTECVSCRLQRNFVSDIRQPSILFELTRETMPRNPSVSEPRLQGSFSIFSSRAPPTA